MAETGNLYDLSSGEQEGVQPVEIGGEQYHVDKDPFLGWTSSEGQVTRRLTTREALMLEALLRPW